MEKESLRVTEFSIQKSTNHLHLPFFLPNGKSGKFQGEITPSPERITPTLSQVAICSLKESIKPGFIGLFFNLIGGCPLGV